MIAGLPRTGKSFLQTAINLFFQLQGKKVLCLAPTNLIAYQQKGTTIHKKINWICIVLDIKRFKCDSLFMDKLIRNNYNNVQNMSLTELCHDIFQLLSNKIFIPHPHSENIIIFIDEGMTVSSTLFSLLFFTYPNSKYVITYGPNQLPPPNGFGSSCNICIGKEDPEKVLFYELVSQMRLLKSSFTEFVKYFSDIISGKTIATTTTAEKLDKLEYFLQNVRIGGSLADYKNLKNDPKRILIVSTNAQRCKENARRLEKEGEGPIFSTPAEMDSRLLKYYVTSRIGIDKILKIRKGVYCIVRPRNLAPLPTRLSVRIKICSTGGTICKGKKKTLQCSQLSVRYRKSLHHL